MPNDQFIMNMHTILAGLREGAAAAGIEIEYGPDGEPATAGLAARWGRPEWEVSEFEASDEPIRTRAYFVGSEDDDGTV